MELKLDTYPAAGSALAITGPANRRIVAGATRYEYRYDPEADAFRVVLATENRLAINLVYKAAEEERSAALFKHNEGLTRFHAGRRWGYVDSIGAYLGVNVDHIDRLVTETAEAMDAVRG